MAPTEEVMMSLWYCWQAPGQSLQMLADITITSLSGGPLTPRSANLFEARPCLHRLTSIFPRLKHVKPLRIPSQPDPPSNAPRDKAAAVAATSARPRSNAFIEALRQGVSKGVLGGLRCIGGEAVTLLRVPKAVSWPIRYILA